MVLHGDLLGVATPNGTWRCPRATVRRSAGGDSGCSPQRAPIKGSGARRTLGTTRLRSEKVTGRPVFAIRRREWLRLRHVRVKGDAQEDAKRGPRRYDQLGGESDPAETAAIDYGPKVDELL